MRKVVYVLLVLLICASGAQAAPGDSTWVQANNVQMDYYNNFDTAIVFPNLSKTYRKIYMIFTVGKYVCPGSPQYCGDWDYTVQSYFMAKHAPDTLELGRLMTPYAHTGYGRFSAAWTNRYIFDVTDYYPALHDSGTVRIHYSGYSGGFTANIKFLFIEGTPERNVLKVDRLWHGDFNYGHGSTPINTALAALTRTAPAGTTATQVKMNITGHGGDDNGCAEFCPNLYALSLNGSQFAQQQFYRNDCSENDLYYQSGTWVYSRANWCPGALVRTYSHPVTAAAGAPYSIGMSFPAYTSTTNNPGTFAASYTIDAAVVYYGATNKTVDASLEDIVAPTDAEYHWRKNPTSFLPILSVRNTGGNAITSIKFQYGVDGRTAQTYTWTGNLPSFTTSEISMPALADLKLSSGVYGFTAKILEVNGAADNDPGNDMLKSSFTAAPSWPSDLLIQLKSNDESLPSNSSVGQTAWRIEDMSGNVIKRKADCGLNTVCQDTVHLSNGAYRLVVTDSAYLGFYDISSGTTVGINQGDGLTGYSSTSGYFRVYDIDQSNLFSLPGYFGGNFGSGFTQYFYVGSPTAVTGIPRLTNASMHAFPNPAGNTISIVVDGLSHSAGTLVLRDMTGRIVSTQAYGVGIVMMDVSSFSNGIYQLNYYPANQGLPRLQQRVVIAH